MNQPFVSFVVPVYGVEPYLRECIESIMAQQSSWELILVDDGVLMVVRKFATSMRIKMNVYV